MYKSLWKAAAREIKNLGIALGKIWELPLGKFGNCPWENAVWNKPNTY